MGNEIKIEKSALYFILVGIAIVILFFVFVFSSGGNDNQPDSNTNRNYLGIGDNGRIYVDGLEQVSVAVDKGTLSELNNILIANDQIGYNELIEEGKVFRADVNSRVLVIDTSFSSKKVRIIDGANSGKAGWLPREWIVP